MHSRRRRFEVNHLSVVEYLLRGGQPRVKLFKPLLYSGLVDSACTRRRVFFSLLHLLLSDSVDPFCLFSRQSLSDSVDVRNGVCSGLPGLDLDLSIVSFLILLPCVFLISELIFGESVTLFSPFTRFRSHDDP